MCDSFCAGIAQVLKAESIAEVWRIFCGEMEELGFDLLLYGATSLSGGRDGGRLDETLVLLNAPDAYADIVLGEELYVHSLTFEWAARHDGFVYWDQALRQMAVHPSPKQGQIRALNAAFDVTAGYIGSLNKIVPGMRGVIGMSTAKRLDTKSTDRLWRDVGDLVEILCNAMHLRIATLPQTEILKPLTTRQLEVLHWCAEGKTIQEIAIIMQISVGTVEKHMRMARTSLEAENTAHAVRKATSLNLLTA